MEGTTPHAGRRLALLPVEERGRRDRPVIRRYRLGRVIGDVGSTLTGTAPRVVQAPASGVRAP